MGPVPESRTVTTVRSYREQAGLSQAALAERVGVSRQTLVAIESGRQVPSTAVALQLSRALGRSVEELFQLRPSAGAAVRLAPLPHWLRERPGTPRSTRVSIGRVGDAWVAHRLLEHGTDAADGVLTDALASGEARVELLADGGDIERNVLVAGCAPLLGVLAQRVGRRHRDARATFVPANSERSLDLLAQGFVHLAGIHLGASGHGIGDGTGDVAAHAAEVRRRFPGRDMLLVNLTRWRVGVAVALGNPLDVRHPEDLLRPDVRFVAREAGAGTTRLLRSELARVGAALPLARAGLLATSHASVADALRMGAADAGLTIESAALAAGLDFVPWAEERFDLALPREQAEAPFVARFLDALHDPAFRTEVAGLPGYDGSSMGRVSTIGAA